MRQIANVYVRTVAVPRKRANRCCALCANARMLTLRAYVAIGFLGAE